MLAAGTCGSGLGTPRPRILAQFGVSSSGAGGRGRGEAGPAVGMEAAPRPGETEKMLRPDSDPCLPAGAPSSSGPCPTHLPHAPVLPVTSGGKTTCREQRELRVRGGCQAPLGFGPVQAKSWTSSQARLLLPQPHQELPVCHAVCLQGFGVLHPWMFLRPQGRPVLSSGTGSRGGRRCLVLKRHERPLTGDSACKLGGPPSCAGGGKPFTGDSAYKPGGPPSWAGGGGTPPRGIFQITQHPARPGRRLGPLTICPGASPPAQRRLWQGPRL